MRSFILSICLLIVFASANAQYFDTGQDPASIHWKQINTENFQIIYPEEFENQAQRVAFIFSEIYDNVAKTLDYSPRKVSVVLHTHTVKSNGLVAWAPKRIEFFTTPHQQTYSQDWLEQLAIHEFRHLVQVDKIEKELPGILRIILGEQAAALVVGAYVPFWFLEGDAVVTETTLSHSGRGRLPSFLMEHKAQLTELGRYSFEKAYLGSYKDFVPNHYKMGYLLVGRLREKYGSAIWKNMLDRVALLPMSINPVDRSMKNLTGYRMRGLYNMTFDELTKEWRNQYNKGQYTKLKRLSPVSKCYTNYIYGACISDSLIFAYRSSLNDISRFVIMDNNQNEEVIYTPGTIFNESVTVKGNWVLWSENRPDIRWTHADRSIIRLYNIETHQKKEIKTTNKLFSPVLSPNEKTFAAVEVDNQNNHFLSIYDVERDELVNKISTTDNQYFYTPCWNENGRILYTVCLAEGGKYLASVDVFSEKLTPITEPTYGDIRNPVFAKGVLYFIGTYNGTDNLYAIHLSSGNLFQVTNVSFGVDYPFLSSNGDKIYLSNYTSKGFGIVELNSDSSGWKPLHAFSLEPDKLADKLAEEELGIPDLQKPESLKYPTKNYSKLSHLINIHSWSPVYIDINSYDVRPGFSVLSQNMLGTAQTRVGYDYDVNDKTGQWIAEFSYSGWFPEFSFQMERGEVASQYYFIENRTNASGMVVNRDTILKRYTWDEFTAGLNVRLPLNFSSGNYYRWFMPEFKYEFENRSHNLTTPPQFSSLKYHALSYRVYLYNLMHMSLQDIYPEWGQQLELSYKNTPFKGNDLGSVFGLQSYLYFPGLLNNHGIKVYQSFQMKEYAGGDYSFSNIAKMPRGYASFQAKEMYSLGIDYKLPLVYPDLSIGRLAYIKRIKAGLFYDYASITVPVVNENQIIVNEYNIELESMGLEISSDVHILRFFAPVDIGFRSIYRKAYDDLSFELILSIDFSGF